MKLVKIYNGIKIMLNNGSLQISFGNVGFNPPGFITDTIDNIIVTRHWKFFYTHRTYHK